MSRRIPNMLGSVFTILGAFGIGWVLHQVVVQEALAPTAPASVLATVGGLVAIAIGRRIERGFDPADYVYDPDPEEDDEEFDEAYSPLSEEQLEGLERDDDH